MKETKQLLCAFLATWAVALTYGFTMRNILLPAVFAVVWVLQGGSRCPVAGRGERALRQAQGPQTGKWVIVGGAVLYTGAVVCATYADAAARFDSGLFRAGTLVIMVCGWMVVFVAIGEWMARTLTVRFADYRATRLASSPRARYASHVSDQNTVAKCSSRTSPKRGGKWGTFAVCMVCYLPWYLYSYPGIFSPDPVNQAEQVLHVIPYSNHHPVIHTLFIGLCYRIGYALWGNVNGGFGCYTFVQMTLLSISFAVIVHTLQTKLHAGKKVLVACVLFFVLVPYHAVQAVTVSKDTMFAVVFILFTCNLISLLQDGCGNVPRILRFIATGVLVCLFRTNGYFAFFVIAAGFVFFLKKERIRAFAMAAAVIVIATLLRGPVMEAYGVEKGDLAESLHLPAQQIARVIVNGRTLTDEEEQLIRDVIDLSHVEELYVPGFADNIKELIRAGHPEVLENNKGRYLKLYFTLGFKHPADYLAAWADLTRGYYYPDGTYEVATLEGVYGNDIGIYHDPKLPVSRLYKVRELVIKFGEFVPLYGALFSMGTFAWIYLFAALVILYQGNDRRRLLIPLAGGAVFLTLLIATPVSDDFRYAYSYIAASPLLLIAFYKYDRIET